MTSSEIRNNFLKFFEERGHTIVPSSPVVPHDDPSLFFTNAGMNQFKDVFLGTGKRLYKRAVDTQKCIRVSGKHNDLEEVGRDTYHHTFFEMLGNWSFGDYYKKEAIEWAWELLTKVWGLPKNRLWATVYKDDEEAEQLWKTMTDIDRSHILRFGEKDNFWEMGETGPCGPCSEIHMDRTPKGNATASVVNAGSPDVMEIWNLVFIQYDRDATGKLTPLPAKHVDTGMGFERMCAVLQGKQSNYETDVFTPLIGRIAEITKKRYSGSLESETDIAMRVIADHVRALTFAVADGAIPSNEGRGYVLRRILRRAARFGRNLDMHVPFVHQLVPTIVETMGNAFPELNGKQEHIRKVIHGEEEGFNATLDRGLEIFEDVVRRVERSKLKVISGEGVFKMYDTYGFPVDLTALLAKEQGLQIDQAGFERLMNKQRERSRGSAIANLTEVASKSDLLELSKKLKKSVFDYESTETIVSSPEEIWFNNLRSPLTKGVRYFILQKPTPFYAESGGQVGDTGELVVNGERLTVYDTKKDSDFIAHYIDDPTSWEKVSEKILQGKTAKVRIDVPRRLSIMRNHTATHLVHEALRRVLGEHLHQHGSLVDDKHLRFDFNHFDRVSPGELQAIEDLVNEKIGENIIVNALNDPKEWVTIEEARRRWPNVKMFFGDKYGDKVRVVEIDPKFSVELCGGTHVKSTSEIGYFKFRTEGSVASGIRRIEAVTFDRAIELLKLQNRNTFERIDYALGQLDAAYKLADELSSLSGGGSAFDKNTLAGIEEKLDRLKDAPEFPQRIGPELQPYFEKSGGRARAVEDIVLQLSDARKQIEKELSKYRIKSFSGSIDQLVQSGIPINGFKLVSSKVVASSTDELKSLGDTLRSRLGSGVGVLAAVIDDKVSLVCVVTDDLVRTKKLEAGKVVGAVAKLLGGGGGGKPHMATAGGKDVARLDEALAQTKSIIESFLHQ